MASISRVGVCRPLKGRRERRGETRKLGRLDPREQHQSWRRGWREVAAVEEGIVASKEGRIREGEA